MNNVNEDTNSIRTIAQLGKSLTLFDSVARQYMVRSLVASKCWSEIKASWIGVVPNTMRSMID